MTIEITGGKYTIIFVKKIQIALHKTILEPNL